VVGTVVPVAGLRVRRRAFMRYLGQGYEIAVELESDPAELSAVKLREQFETGYRELYGRVIPDLEVEVLSWTVNVSEPSADRMLPADAVAFENAVAPAGQRAMVDPIGGRRVTAGSVDRSSLVPGDYIDGPALIGEEQTTVVVCQGFRACVSERGNLVIETAAGRGGDG
jgi:N-methylhydantoinase A